MSVFEKTPCSIGQVPVRILGQFYSPYGECYCFAVIFVLRQVILPSAVLRANKISLLRREKYHYAARHNITLCVAQNITDTFQPHRFYVILHIGGGNLMKILKRSSVFTQFFFVQERQKSRPRRPSTRKDTWPVLFALRRVILLRSYICLATSDIAFGSFAGE